MGFIVPPSKWEIQHAGPIFAAQKYQAANDGRLPDTPVWRMLQFRHELNARRFNFYHPNIGKMIETQNLKPPAPPVEPSAPPPDPQVPPVIPPINPPPDPGGGTGVDPGPGPNPQVPAVPEPSAFLMLGAAILVMGLGFTRFRRRSN